MQLSRSELFIFVCPGMEGTVRRHNQLRDKLATTLSHRSIGITPHIEYALLYDSAVLGKGPTEQRRMDLMIDTLEFSPKKHGFDATVASPHASHAIRIAGRTAEDAATKAENTELDTYEYDTMCIRGHGNLPNRN